MKPAIALTEAYGVPRARGFIDLKLDDNVGPQVESALLDNLDPALVRRYPDARALEARLAQRFGVSPEQVIVTAGADDALERACRVLLAPGREMVLPVPTFEMLERYAAWTGAEVWRVPYGDYRHYPLDGVLASLGPRTAAVAVVTPNNPTGTAVSPRELDAIADAAGPEAMLLVDEAYGEFADDPLSARALALPNAIVFRTLSKAWGLAGLRVGYAIGPVEVIRWLRAAGHPYPVSSPSLAIALLRLDRPDPASFVAQVRVERDLLSQQLSSLGVEAWPSQGNFVLCRTPRAAWLCDGLAGLGIAVRSWSSGELANCVRITCPGDAAAFERLGRAIASVLQPEALLFDMDGVLADVRDSYRRAIIETAQRFEISLTPDDVARAKERGDANNDWRLTQRLLADAGRDVPLEQVTQCFEELYQGGLWQRETLLCERSWLAGQSLPCAVVTGRPRADAQRFVDQVAIAECFADMVCMEDAPAKPDPASVRLACSRLGVERAWMVGDTPDDIAAARAAGVVPIGFGAEPEALLAAGAARVLSNLEELSEL